MQAKYKYDAWGNCTITNSTNSDIAKANAIGGSYATGFISNYQNEGDYQGPFIDFGGGFLAGVDHCYDPRCPYDDTVRATSSTYGNGKGVYFGYDYYGYWCSIPFWTE